MGGKALTSRGTWDKNKKYLIGLILILKEFKQNKQAVSRLAVSFRRYFLEKFRPSPSPSLTCRLPGSLQEKGEVVLAELLSSKHQEFEKNPFRVFSVSHKLCCRPLVGSLAAGPELYLKEVPLHHPKKPFRVGEFFRYP